MNRPTLASLVVLLVASGAALAPTPALAQGGPSRLQRAGTQLVKDGQPFRAVGGNKWDLAYQFTFGGAEPRPLSSDLAAKDLLDAGDRGIAFLRFSLLGFVKDDLEAYERDPAAFKRRLQALCDAARAAHVALVPSLAWRPAIFSDETGEGVGRLFRDPTSPAFARLVRYVNDVVPSLAGRDEVLFWELGNEINLEADLAHGLRGGSAADDYSTDDMIGFLARFAAAVHSADPTRPITAGHSSPRSCAQHLRRSPEWTGHTDWTNDSEDELRAYVAEVNPDPLDVISMHAYDSEVQQLSRYKAAADAAGKPLYVGEFASSQPSVTQDPRAAGAVFAQFLAAFEANAIPLASFWDFHFFQFDPTVPDPFCMIANVNDDLFALVLAQNVRSGAVAAGRPTSGTPRAIVAAPQEGAHLAPGQVQTVWVHASDPALVERVDVLVDGTVVGSVASFPFAVQWTAGAPGPHSISAVVTGASGVARSSAVHVTVDGAIPAGSIVTVNAASRWTQVAPGSLACTTGTGLAGATVAIQDSTGATAAATVVSATDSQVLWLVPASAASGPAPVTVTCASGAVSSGSVEVLAPAPGVHSADRSGSGTAAAGILRLRADGTVSVEDASQPIAVGATNENVFLSLYGTGTLGPGTTTVTVGEVACPVLYAGPQGAAGLDQVNVLLPPCLAGRGPVTVVLAVAGRRANPVALTIQ